jgi:zinc protease
MSKMARTSLPLALLATLSVPAANAGDHVSCESYVLDNGMRVVLAPDPTLPIVAVDVWFDVGAKDEPPGRSGFAHLFEHLMFMGTERVPLGMFDRIMERGGGRNNASTYYDRTNYWSTGPAELLDVLLWLDADRLEDLGRATTQEKLDLQREVVRNERRQTSENVPYGKSQLKLAELLFPAGHPYHFEVIGSHHDLEAASLDDVKEFFANFYVPNNAILVVCGDFDPAVTRDRIATWFGTLPRGASPARRDLGVPPLRGVVRHTMLDAVDAPGLRFAWHSPANYAPGDADLRLAARILGDDRSGRLYRRLVLEDGLASSVGAGQDSAAGVSSFEVEVIALPGADLDAIDSAVHQVIAKLAIEGPTPDEVERARAAEELRILEPLGTVLGRAARLAEYTHFLREPDGFGADLARHAAVTPSSLRANVAASLGADRHVAIRVLPLAPARSASPRDGMPEIAASKSFAAPRPYRASLDNGLEIAVAARSALPKVELSLLLFGEGPALDPAGREGVARLLADLLLEGAGARDGVAFSEAVKALGADFAVRAERECLRLDLVTPRPTLEPLLDLLAEVLLDPRLLPSDFERVRRLAMEETKRRLANPDFVAGRVADRALFGAEHPLGAPDGGTLASLAAIDHALVVALHRSFDPRRARLFAAGAVGGEELRAMLDARLARFVGASTVAPPRLALAAAPAMARPRLLLVDRPGAVQTAVCFAFAAPGHEDASRVARELVSIVVGEGFTSRLNQNLREAKGYAYGAGSRLRTEPAAGSWIASSSIRADVLGPALGEFLKEFARLEQGFDDEEFDRARAQYRTRAIEGFEDLGAAVGTLVRLARKGLDERSVEIDLERAATLSRDAVEAVAREMARQPYVLVLVGDAATIEAQLPGLALPAPERIDVEGAARDR